MSTIVNVIRDIIRGELAELRLAEMAVVEPNGLHPHSSASDKDNYACDVRLKNSGLVLRHVPVATDRVGTVAIPNEGDLVLLAFSQGDVNQPIIIGRLYADDDRPPLNRADEFVFRLPLAEPNDDTVRFEIRNRPGETPQREFMVDAAQDRAAPPRRRRRDTGRGHACAAVPGRSPRRRDPDRSGSMHDHHRPGW